MADKVFSKMNPSEINEGDVFVAMDHGCDITRDREYVIQPRHSPWTDWFFIDDGGDQRTQSCHVTLVKKEAVVEKVLPVVEFRFFRDDQKATILLAKSKGERIQLLVDFSNWVEHTGAIHPDGIYRLTPRKVIETENRRAELVASISKTETSLRLA